MSDTAFYDLLGVETNATRATIRKRFYVESLKWHPDKNPAEKKAAAEEKFKEASEAYAVLSDETKRAKYDRFGFSGLGGAAGAHGGAADFGDLGGQPCLHRVGGGFRERYRCRPQPLGSW